MSEGPYRPGPASSEADAALARLAAMGEHRIRDAAAARASEAAAAAHADEGRPGRNVRLALGAYYKGPLQKVGYALMPMGPLTFACAALLDKDPGPAMILGCFVVGVGTLVGGFLVAFSSKPAASRARVAAERAWAGSLPFALDDYFELLAEEPTVACRLLIKLTWRGQRPAPETVRGALGVWDAGVAVEPGEGVATIARSGPFVCGYFFGRGTVQVVNEVAPNRRIVARVHHLVDRVLLPLHRSHPLARVSLGREVIPGALPWQRFPNA